MQVILSILSISFVVFFGLLIIKKNHGDIKSNKEFLRRHGIK